MPQLLYFLDALLVALGAFLIKALANRKSPPYPPGPRPLPLVGNVVDMPSEKEWLTFARWKNKYGPIVSVSVFGQRLIIVNSAKIATDMLESRGAIYSDRPRLEMGGELVGWKNTLVLVPYGERLKNSRRLAHQLFGSHATMNQFLPVEERETRRFLQRLLATPNDFSAHIRKTAGAIILRISHGYDVQEGDDPFVSLADKATEQFSLSTAPGLVVNLFPALRYLPEWLPGGGFHKTAREWAETLHQMVEQPYQFVKDQMQAGTAQVSFVSSLLQDHDLSPQDDFDLKWTAASLYSGGADTTVAAINAFFKAMALYPQVQKKAQAEIAAVVGHDRLPSFSDRENLPYVNALALEVLRFHTVAPTGVPHRVTKDDIYEGYFIPEGALIIANIWQMAHDPEVYSDPMTFNPDRFLQRGDKEPEPDPRELSFGFGRRICPGRILADASVFISCAMTLAVFDIAEYREGDVVFEIDLEQTTGTISHPTEFKCSIRPRSEKAVALVESSS